MFRSHSIIDFLAFGLLFLSGCSVDRIAKRQMLTLTINTIRSYDRETDLQLAEEAMAGGLKMLEGMVLADSLTPELLYLTCRAFSRYTSAFAEPAIEEARFSGDTAGAGVLRKRAVALYARAAEYGLKALRIKTPETDSLLAGDSDRVALWLDQAEVEDVPAFFWYAFAEGSRIRYADWNLSELLRLKRAELIMQRVIEVDDDYAHGSAYAWLGVYYATLPVMTGGDPERSREYFTEAVKVTDGDYLPARLAYIRFHILDKDNDAAADALNELRKTIIDQDSELALDNMVAKSAAQRYLAHLQTQ